MSDREQAGGSELARQEQAVAEARATRVVQEMVAEFGGRTVLPVRSRLLTWPGVNGVDPEPIASLEAAHKLERAAHALQLDYIRLARVAGRSWSEIGYALELYWAASANKESIADAAYEYAMSFEPILSRRKFIWTCPACQQAVTDQGPWPDPPGQEDGHADNCPRWAARLAEWQRRQSDH